MQPLKNMFGIIGALIPILYCLGFLVYFVGVEYWTGVPVGDALGPTIIGVGAVAILLTIPLILRIARLYRQATVRLPDPASTAEIFGDAPGDFDPDAAIARYLAGRSAAPAPAAPDPAAAPGPAPGARRSFGRKRS